MLSRLPFPLLLAPALIAALAGSARAGQPLDGVFTATNGLAGPYRMIVPDGASRSAPVGLLLFFHPDGDVEHFQAAADDLALRGEKSHLAIAALSVPRPGGSDGLPAPELADRCWWAPRAESNARYVGEWIDEVAVGSLGEQLDLDRVVFAGISGGGDFAIAVNLHLGYPYRGGAIALCGGDLPRADGGSCVEEPGPSALDPLPTSGDLPAGAVDAFHYSFDLTGDDSLLPLARLGRDYYEGLGFAVSFHVPPGSGHCGFDTPLDELLDSRIEQLLSRLPAQDCETTELTPVAVALVDEVPLEVARQAIPEADPMRPQLLADIQAALDAIAALSATLPEAVKRCTPRSICPKLELGDTKREIRKHLIRLKQRLVPKALGRTDDRALRETLRDANRASHLAKRAALRQIPNQANLCEL